jgi:hypothetical protein
LSGIVAFDDWFKVLNYLKKVLSYLKKVLNYIKKFLNFFKKYYVGKILVLDIIIGIFNLSS